MRKKLPGHYHPSIQELEQSINQPLESLRMVRPRKWVYRSGQFLFLGLFLLAVSLLWLPWQQTSFGVGSVIPFDPSERLQELHAPVKGLIDQWYVVEGAMVKKGDPIVDVADVDPQLMSRLKQQEAAVTAGVNAADMAVETSKKNLARQKLLAQKGLKSQRDYEVAQLEYQKLLAERASKEKMRTDIEVKLSRQSSQVVQATRDGQIMRIYYPEGGALIKQGATLATLAPTTTNKVVELLIKGNDLPLLSEGRSVRLQFEGWPAIQFSGWPSVAVGTFSGTVKNIDPSDNGKGYFRIFVKPDSSQTKWPEGHYLRQGVRVKGWVLLESVPLGYEMWRVFNGFPPVIRYQEKKESDWLKRFNKQLGKIAK
jgi:hypothetical protein